MDVNMAGSAFDEEYERIAASGWLNAPLSSAEPDQASLNSVSNAPTAPAYVENGFSTESQWPETSFTPERSQSTFYSRPYFEPEAKHAYRYPDIQSGFTSSDPSTSQASESLFCSPMRDQDPFNMTGAFEYDSKPADEPQDAQPMAPSYQPTPNSLVGPTIVDGELATLSEPALFDALQKHFDRITELKDLVAAAKQTATDHEARIKAELEEMWENNTNIRPRGLVGGTARKNRSIHGDYVKFKDTAAISKSFLEHRREVEDKDLKGRNRIAGLKSLQFLCSEVMEDLQQQREYCQTLLGYATLIKSKVCTDKFAKLTEIEGAVFGVESVRKVADIEEMLESIRTEYDTTL